MGSILTGNPNHETVKMAFVLLVILDSIKSGSIFQLDLSESTKTGTPPK